MQANETKLRQLIEGTKQYLVPLFQRTYSWDKKEWSILWDDIRELSQLSTPKPHFFGSIVTAPVTSVPQGVSKYLLIDGQQRLTTIFVLLTLVRDKVRAIQNSFAEEINETLLVNKFQSDLDFYKLLPTQVDRTAYKNLIHQENKNFKAENPITKAYEYFEKRLKQEKIDSELEKLKKLKIILTESFSIVSIVLDSSENPYLVFESLNAKGRPLTQADLIRNYFFMLISIDEQEKIYNEHWLPMQESLGENLSEFIRHFLMKDGGIVKQNEIYSSLKDKVSKSNNVTHYIKELKTYSTYYKKLLEPELESDESIKKMLIRLNRIEVTTAYPLLLNFYHDHSRQKLSRDDFIEILKVLENYLIRRFICNIPTNQLNKIFPHLYSSLSSQLPKNPVDGIKSILQTKGYPKDSEFKIQFLNKKFYTTHNTEKTKLILETIEDSYQSKEPHVYKDFSIEHIMPQSLSVEWKNHLGENWKEVHELYVDTIGNLTLTGNLELSNKSFEEKKAYFKHSNLQMNRNFSQFSRWTRAEIEKRTEELFQKALEVWKYFGSENNQIKQNVTGTRPTELKILGQNFQVQSWREVLETTMNTIADLEPDKFEELAKNFPNLVGKDKNQFRKDIELKNGYFLESNLSAEYIYKFCNQAIEMIGLSSEDWQVIYQ